MASPIHKKKCVLGAVVIMTIFGFLDLAASADNCSGSGGIGIAEAVKAALAENLDARLSRKGVRIQEGAARHAEGIFDRQLITSVERGRSYTPLAEHDRPLYTDGRRITESLGYGIRYNRLLPSGTSLNHTVDFEKSTENMEFQADIPNRGRVAAGFSFPLMRGKGSDVVKADIDAARLELEAEIYGHSQVLSSIAAEAARAYWEYKSAVSQLETHMDSENRARKLLEDTKVLVDADEVPRAELDGLEANLAQKIAVTLEAQQAVVISRHELGLIMGLDVCQIDGLKLPADSFPQWNVEAVGDLMKKANSFALAALENRKDYMQSKLLYRAARKKYERARNTLRPELNFELEAGVSGYVDGHVNSALIDSLHRNREGVDISGRLVYCWPVDNNDALGIYDSKLSHLEQTKVDIEKKSREIRSRVIVALSGLYSSAGRLMEIQRAMDMYQKAVHSENSKFRLGMSTLLDVIQIEDRLTDAHIQMIGAQYSYAAAIIDFRYSLGMLVDCSEDAVRINSADLMTLPVWDRSFRPESEPLSRSESGRASLSESSFYQSAKGGQL